ncbi:MAG: adenylyltransferase/cytidyltransferase family protein [Lachnospiraceae bacterium]|nr:adenylyltransferase/cytidyltransferase family protein [Lachnospiraceae bacterium]
MGKIITKEEYKEKMKDKLKQENKKVVLCHGVFDLIHPGHIIHFEQAKGMGDILVVSITSEKYVRKGPGRPYFNNELRMKFLEAIEYIDYVMLSEGYTVDDIVEAVEPDIYVKGEEYKKPKEDITGKITEEQALVEKHGGKIMFTAGQVFSSTHLINTALSGLPEDVRSYMESFKTRYSMKDIKEYTAKVSRLKVLVIGDIIIDKYIYCIVQGMMTKDMGYSARQKGAEEYFGGAAAIARHLSSFNENVTLMSIIGNEENIRLKMFDELADSINLKLIYSEKVPTIIKRRYLTRNEKRDEYKKIFAINNIPEKIGYEKFVQNKFAEKLTEIVDAYDVVFLCDFGHGLIDEKIMDIVQKRAKYLVLNCQTNSSNKGMNIITKYHRADAFTLDQQEIAMAYPSYSDSDEIKLKKLGKHLNSVGWLTRGPLGAIQINKNNEEEYSTQECPAFTLSVKDTIGAGDAFFALSGIFTAAGAPVEIGTFMGNIGGALGANIVGNKEHVEKVNALKFASTLLNI